MNKVWTRLKSGQYQFRINDQVAGELKLNTSSLDVRGDETLGQKTYTIRQTGFWRGVTEMRDAHDLPVARIKAEKWYSSSYRLEYRGHPYKLVLRNSPHLEWAIQDQDRTLLAYGLAVEKNKSTVQIRSDVASVDPELDALLWYQLLPTVMEDMGDTFSFLVLAT
ncbi:MAG: hypothetical protein GC205_11875 [Bacteroidetes bacterium]|nr:hypothetical protein [Bacteroidota bacterium]